MPEVTGPAPALEARAPGATALLGRAARGPRTVWLLGVPLVVLGLAHWALHRTGEPFYYNDETRHVMTGVFFRDFFCDFPLSSPREYAVRYYLQYPALGLLVWPPFFHALEGMAMMVLGTSFMVSRTMIWLFFAMACVYLFFLVRRTHGPRAAVLAVCIFGVSPVVLDLSRYVMLEIPTLALCLAAAYHAVRYLELESRHDLLFAGLASALAACTRFDGVYLAPLLGLFLLLGGRLAVLKRKEVLATLGLAICLAAPVYALTAHQFGWLHMRTLTEGSVTGGSIFREPANLLFYPTHLPEQIGWFALIPALIGLAAALRAPRLARSWPYLAMVAAIYVTFTLLSDFDSRHVVYWVPAFAVFAVEGMGILASRLPALRAGIWLPLLVIAGTAWSASWTYPCYFLRGYEDAARYVVENSPTARFCLFDGGLNGNFVYQIRRHDPSRRLWVLRGDKLLYSTLMDYDTEYKEYAKTDDEILAMIYKYDPEMIVVEDPGLSHRAPAGLRRLLWQRADRFRPEAQFLIEKNTHRVHATRLLVYRNVYRNPEAESRLELDMQSLRSSFSLPAEGAEKPGG